MATRIGVDNLVYAVMTTEDTALIAPVYDTPVAAIGVMSINVNPNASQETLFADDGPMETAGTLGKIDVEIMKNALTTENLSDLLGHAIDSKGAVVYGAADVPPWVAIGFRSLKSNGNYKYTWLYKGKFVDPESANETKGDSINFQADTIKGQFVKLSYPYLMSGGNVWPWKYEIDGDFAEADATVITNWFTAPTMPSLPAPLLAAVWAAGSVTGSTKATITPGGGNTLAYKVGTEILAPPAVGDAVSGTTAYTSGADITGVEAGDWVSVYELDGTSLVVKFVCHELASGEINNT